MSPDPTEHAAPAALRARMRAGEWTSVTSGQCPGYVQANLAILPAELADDFERFCLANPQALPLLERTATGVPDRLEVAPGADLRTDLPRYRVHRDGAVVDEPTDIAAVWRDDLVAFLLGCSFSAEEELIRAGVRLRHLGSANCVPVFRTSVVTEPVGPFRGPLVVSMRPIRNSDVALSTEVTSRMPFAHGGPVQIGDPAAIGIEDLGRPDWGDPLPPAADEVPVFWACGVTPQAVLAEVAPPFAITHAPGHMFVTDRETATLLRAG